MEMLIEFCITASKTRHDYFLGAPQKQMFHLKRKVATVCFL